MRMQIKMNVSFILTLSRTFIATIANFVNVYNDAKLCFNPTFLRMPILLVWGHVTSLPGLKLGSEQQTVALQQSFPNNFPWAASHANTCTNSLDTHATYPPPLPSPPTPTLPFHKLFTSLKLGRQTGLAGPKL